MARGFGSRLGLVFGALVPHVGFTDCSYFRLLPRLSHQVSPRAVESPFARVDRETETRDERTAGEIRIVFVMSGLGAASLEQVFMYPVGNVRPVTGVHITDHQDLRQQQRPMFAGAMEQPLPVQRFPMTEDEMHDVRHVMTVTFA